MSAPTARAYPAGLKGSAIPIEARILAVADAFEAMTADRVYRKECPSTTRSPSYGAAAARSSTPDVVQAFLRGLNDADHARPQPHQPHAAAS